MRIVTVNVNGIRSAARKGFFPWLARQAADVVCVQEVRAHADQIAGPPFQPRNLHCQFALAEKKGYSGVAIYSRAAPDDVRHGFGSAEFDREGRYVEARFGDLIVVSVYVPSGSSGESRQQTKYRFMAEFDAHLAHLAQLRRDGRHYVICGDWNIAHQPIDLRNWRSNQKNSGFLPDERAWFDRLLTGQEFVDAFREVNQEPGQYTWWSNRGQAWAKNVGWRIDYQIVSPGLRGRVRAAKICKARRFSDHAPLIVDYDLR